MSQETPPQKFNKNTKAKMTTEMSFVRTFSGGSPTAILTVENKTVSVRWRGEPTKSILPEYEAWMLASLQTVADSTGKRILYLAPGSQTGFMVADPSPTTPNAATAPTAPAAGQAEQVQAASHSNLSSSPK
jgi:hypothetical protein